MINLIFKIKDSISRKLTNFIWKLRLKKIGQNTVIDTNVKIYNPLDIEIGNDCTINTGVILQSCEGAKIILKNNIVISYNSLLITGGLNTNRASKNEGHTKADIIIHSNVWISANCTILAGVEIGSGSIIAAGSVVSKSIPRNVIAAGIPAKIIKEISTS